MSGAIQKIQPVPKQLRSGEFSIRVDATGDVKPEVAEKMSSLHPMDRIETLGFAFEEALAAGQQNRGAFNVDAGLAALSGGTISLKGNPDQIDAQLKLIEGARVILRNVCESMGYRSLQTHERVETLAMAFLGAQRAGTIDNGFDVQRAVEALTSGRLELNGNAEQIQGKSNLVRLAAALIERACRYPEPFFDAPKPMHYLRSDRVKRIKAEVNKDSRAKEEAQNALIEAGYEAGRRNLKLTKG